MGVTSMEGLPHSDDAESAREDVRRATSPGTASSNESTPTPTPLLAGTPSSAGGAPGKVSAGGGADNRDRRRRRRARPKKPPRHARWWELPLLVIVAVAVAVLVKSFVVQPFYIPSDSMEKTLHGCEGCAGDKILVNKPIYRFRAPEPGDIVVFHNPQGWAATEATPVAPRTNALTGPLRRFAQLVGIVPPDEKDLVKRVIATGGEGVRCCDAQGRVQVSQDGLTGPWRSLNEPYIYEDNHQQFGPVLVPHGRLWVMGDHRGDSADSRYHPQGCHSAATCDPVSSTVSVSDVIGKAFVIAWPPNRWRTLGTPATFATVDALSTGLPTVAGMVSVVPLALGRRSRRRLRRGTGSPVVGDGIHNGSARRPARPLPRCYWQEVVNAR